jgi:hypothetical protein
MAEPETWRPLLEGNEAEQAWQAVLEVAAALRGPMTARLAADPTVASGNAGIALFYSYLAQALADDVWADAAVSAFDRMVEAVPDAPLLPGLWSGLLGVGWTAEHLRGRLFATGDEEGEEEDDDAAAIDEALWTALRQRSKGEYDLIRGFVGMGVYAAERLPRPRARESLLLLLVHLFNHVERGPAGGTWHTPPELLPPSHRELYPRGYYNLGMAHGVPGVIALLGSLAAAGLLDGQSRPLLDGAVDWLLAQELPAGAVSRFPSFAGPGIAPEPSRLAWCYGDPGVAVALLGAARGAGNADWEREALRVALAAAEREPASSGVVDAGLCHGAAGVGHLFNRLWQATGEERLAAAARAWFRRTLDLRRPGEGTGGFSAWNPEKGWEADPSLLTGAAGIAVALLAAISPLAPEWDRLFLASPLMGTKP